jgi:hypothetical protein
VDNAEQIGVDAKAFVDSVRELMATRPELAAVLAEWRWKLDQMLASMREAGLNEAQAAALVGITISSSAPFLILGSAATAALMMEALA